MGLRDASRYLPVPDPGNTMWMWMAGQALGALGRANNLYTLAAVLVAIYIIAILIFVFYVGRYVFSVYVRRLREGGSHALTWIGALIIAAILFVISISMVFSGNYYTNEQGRILISNTFCLFAVFVAAYDWWLDRPQAKALPSIKGLSAEDVIKMHKTVQVAKKG